MQWMNGSNGLRTINLQTRSRFSRIYFETVVVSAEAVVVGAREASTRETKSSASQTERESLLANWDIYALQASRHEGVWSQLSRTVDPSRTAQIRIHYKKPLSLQSSCNCVFEVSCSLTGFFYSVHCFQCGSGGHLSWRTLTCHF